MVFALEELSKSPWLINGICPYFTMFPIQYPVNILNNISNHTVVFDPFSGRGTSLFAARMFGFEAYGIDSNPVAVAISKSKLANVNVCGILESLMKALDYNGDYEVPQSEFWELAYDGIVLEQLCKIRAYLLLHDGPNERALRGLILGALHGPKAKNKDNASYLSNQMPRTYASKPTYSIKFWKKNNLKPDQINIEKVIRKRALRFYDVNIPNVYSDVILGDSRVFDNYRMLPQVNLIITSPPYYGMRTYYTDQWLRNWFLGGPDTPANILNNQIDHSSPYEFALNLGTVWENCARVSSDTARMFVRYGSIPSRKASALDIFKRSIEFCGNRWRIVNIVDAGNSQHGKRQAVQMLSNKESQPSNEFDVELIRNA